MTYAAKISKAEAIIDWRSSAEQIERQVCAFNPWPVAETRWQGRQLRIWEACAAPEDSSAIGSAAPATVLGLLRGQLQVQCGSGVLAISRLQSAGRRIMSAGEFAAGAALAGARLD